MPSRKKTSRTTVKSETKPSTRAKKPPVKPTKNTKKATKTPPKKPTKKPSRKSTRNTKTELSIVPADDSLTSEALSEVPARCFPRFQKLPVELQTMIFELYALDEAFVEVAYQHPRFYSSSSRTLILPKTIHNESKCRLFPIYLVPSREMGRRRNGGPIQPIYIQAKDILYIPQIHALDVKAFLSREENHVIENMAIHTSSAVRLGWSTGDLDNPNFLRYSFKAMEEGKLVCGLRNLKNLYIVEGSHLGKEMVVYRHPSQTWNYSLSQVEEGPEFGKTDYSGVFTRDGGHEWNTGVAESITRDFATEIEMMKRRGKDWNPPELVFRELSRKLVKL